MINELNRLWQYSKGFRLRIFITIILSCLGVLFSILFVETTKHLLDNISNGIELSFVSSMLFLVGTKVFQLICEQSEIYLRNTNRVKLENELEYHLFCNLIESRVYSDNNIHSGDSIYRLSSDVGIVAEGISFTIPTLIYSFVQLLATGIYLMTMQPELTILLALIAPSVIVVTYYYTRVLSPVSKDVRRRGSEVNQYFQEHIQHKELISILGQQQYVQSQAKNIQNKFLTVLLKQIKITIGVDSITEIGLALSYLSIFIWGIYSIPRGNMTYGIFVVFLQLVGQLQRPIFLLKDQYPSFISALASTERIQEIKNLPNDYPTENRLVGDDLGLRFENVYFEYPKNHKQILTNFSWDFKPGTVTAVMGETGVGKSTLIKLIFAFLNPNQGKISIYKNNNAEDVLVSNKTRCNFIYVPQGNNLISGSIRYNLQLGNPGATDEEMKKALWVSAAEFVYSQFPDGLDTVIGEKGFSISEGQAQRISVARGLLKPGAILILDEPTSALDCDTEQILYTRLNSYCIGKTVIVITHRQTNNSYFQNILTLKPLLRNK